MNMEELRQKRKKWVEANRENGFEDGIKRLLTDIYPDNAHFIYELLQNAEDAKATEIRFILKMVIIRDQGLLTVGFLSTLPNNKDNLPPFYKPIMDSLIKVFQSEDLTPMKQGGHAAASGIFQSEAQLSNLISDDDLARILGEDYSPPMWVANPQLRFQREDNFLSMLNISLWKTENFISRLSVQSESIMKWLAEKTDEWHQQLYALLGDFLSNAPSSEAYNRKKNLAGLRIVRISDGTYSIGNKCYFPSDGVEHDNLMPRVAKGVYTSGKNEQQQEKARKFLDNIGVRAVGEAEQLEAILKQRYTHETEISDEKMYYSDLKRFIALVEKEPSQASLFSNYYIFNMANGKWGNPSQVYLDSPFYDTGLTDYYEAIGDKSQCWGLSQNYKACEISPEKIGDFAKKTGAKTSLDIKETVNSYSIDYTIDNLGEILQLKKLSISKLIWNVLAEHERNSTVNYLFRKDKARIHYSFAGDSNIINTLKQNSWIPQIFDQDLLRFFLPTSADSKFLPEGFTFDKGWEWVTTVKFGSSARQREESERLVAQRKTAEYQHTEEVTKSLGFDSTEEAKEMAELKRKDPEGYKKWHESNKKKPSFPIKTVVDPERRQERVLEQLADAPEKEYKKCERSVRTTSGSIDPALWLRNQYNHAGKMECQICTEEMPFKKRNGEYYFEAVEALSKDYFPKEHEAQYLALCPLCAAKYNEFVKKDEGAMTKLRNALLGESGFKISVYLGDLDANASIRFVETHYQDMKTILKHSGF